MVSEGLVSVVGLLSFNDDSFRTRVEHSLEVGHLGSDRSVTLLLAAKGKDEDKRAWVEGMIPRAANDASDLRAWLEYSWRPNPFADVFSDLYRYVVLRLTAAVERWEQAVLPLSQAPGRQGNWILREDDGVALDLADRLWQRMASHPLASGHVRALGH
jgi:hypothetical protein